MMAMIPKIVGTQLNGHLLIETRAPFLEYCFKTNKKVQQDDTHLNTTVTARRRSQIFILVTCDINDHDQYDQGSGFFYIIHDQWSGFFFTYYNYAFALYTSREYIVKGFLDTFCELVRRVNVWMQFPVLDPLGDPL